ncbi:hypothetical protein [Acidithiobacillus ferrivorans]|uniref:hypothetical protein n=1 Tax=Acidithiobacillus ferrivorans TaxID=160808 RepID=UPI00054E59DE|nr:hypothetical protein [Acidithiobacillus ferrivorans]
MTISMLPRPQGIWLIQLLVGRHHLALAALCLGTNLYGWFQDIRLLVVEAFSPPSSEMRLTTRLGNSSLIRGRAGFHTHALVIDAFRKLLRGEIQV